MAVLPGTLLEVFSPIELAQAPAPPKTPRAEPLTFGYMRLASDNPYIDTYRRMLQAENPHRIYEDLVVETGKFAVFGDMIAELRPNDTVIMVRLNHIGRHGRTIYDGLKQLAAEKVGIRLIANALRPLPPTSALLLDLIREIDPIVMADCVITPHKGGDGGSGNGGP